MIGKIMNYRVGRRTQRANQMVVAPEGFSSSEAASKSIGKVVEWITPSGKKIKGKIVAQERVFEKGDHGEYTVVIELLEFEDERNELRFGYYSRKRGSGDNDWNWAQRAAVMSPETFKKLLKNAKKNQDFGNSLK